MSVKLHSKFPPKAQALAPLPAKENYESTYRERGGCETKYFIQSAALCPDSLAYWLKRLINFRVDQLYVEGDWVYATLVTWVTECCTESANICFYRDNFNKAQWEALLEDFAHKRGLEAKRARKEAEWEARKAQRKAHCELARGQRSAQPQCRRAGGR